MLNSPEQHFSILVKKRSPVDENCGRDLCQTGWSTYTQILIPTSKSSPEIADECQPVVKVCSKRREVSIV